MSSTESLIQRKHKQPQHQNMTKVGHRKHHRKHFVKDVEAVVSLDDISVRDVEQENEDEAAKQRPEDWTMTTGGGEVRQPLGNQQSSTAKSWSHNSRTLTPCEGP